MCSLHMNLKAQAACRRYLFSDCWNPLDFPTNLIPAGEDHRLYFVYRHYEDY